MVSSRELVLALLLGTMLLGSACSVGNGEGRVGGTVAVPGCDVSDEPYELEPSFFGGEPVDGQYEIRIQHGSDFEDKSDGMLILVRDTERVRRELIGLRIPITGEFDSLVRVSLYLNESCPTGREEPPVHFEARSGTITFTGIYAPSIDEDEVETTAQFDVEMVDPLSDPLGRDSERSAQLSGEFRFLYNRGRPAQRFP